MFLVTLILFAIYLQLPVEQRVQIYLPSVRGNLPPEQMARLVEITIDRYGLDDPLPVQYLKWLKSVITGDWGYSPTWRQPVIEGLRQRAPATVELLLGAMLPSLVLAIVLGSLAARRHALLPDHVIQSAAFLGWAFPPFIVALVLINVFYAWLGWFPPERLSLWASTLIRSGDFRPFTGLVTVDALLNGNLALFWDAVRHLVLPALSLAALMWALLTRIMRASLLGVLHRDYVRTARAKGLGEGRVVARHARRNAILPVISTGGVIASMLITHVVVIEMVFNLNGLGRGSLSAMMRADMPVTMGFTLMSCLVTVLASLIADVLYAVVDPRVRVF